MKMSVKGIKSNVYYTIRLVYSSVSIFNLIPIQSDHTRHRRAVGKCLAADASLTADSGVAS